MYLSSASKSSHKQRGEAVDNDVLERAVTASRGDGLDSTTEPRLETQAERLTGFRLFLVMFNLTLAVFLMLLDSSVVATVRQHPVGSSLSERVANLCDRRLPKSRATFIPSMTLGGTGQHIFWRSKSPTRRGPPPHTVVDIGLPSCAFQPLSGKIYSYFNVKWTFLAFFAIFEIGSALCGAAVSSTMLIVGRAVAGLGGSGLLNGGYTMIALAVPVAKQAGQHSNPRGRTKTPAADKRGATGYRGVMMSLSFFGLVSGPLIGGALTQFTTWRWCKRPPPPTRYFI